MFHGRFSKVNDLLHGLAENWQLPEKEYQPYSTYHHPSREIRLVEVLHHVMRLATGEGIEAFTKRNCSYDLFTSLDSDKVISGREHASNVRHPKVVVISTGVLDSAQRLIKDMSSFIHGSMSSS